jgi:hypothetical protein
MLRLQHASRGQCAWLGFAITAAAAAAAAAEQDDRLFCMLVLLPAVLHIPPAAAALLTRPNCHIASSGVGVIEGCCLRAA